MSNEVKEEINSDYIKDLLKRIDDLTEKNEDLTQENYKLGLRIDVCLYAMVNMQSMLRAWEKRNKKNVSGYKASLTDPGKIWLAE